VELRGDTKGAFHEYRNAKEKLSNSRASKPDMVESDGEGDEDHQLAPPDAEDLLVSHAHPFQKLPMRYATAFKVQKKRHPEKQQLPVLIVAVRECAASIGGGAGDIPAIHGLRV
jgi:hypothetical protein